MIYRCCLIYDGDIIPHPTIDEREQIRKSGGKAAKKYLRRGDIRRPTNRDLRSCAGITYATDWPSVALLAVSKEVREEAAKLLFGLNVWRLSYVEPWTERNEDAIWRTYQSYFRHISTHMSMNDTTNMLHIIKQTRADRTLGNWSRIQLKNASHEKRLAHLAHGFEWKHEILAFMNLKSMVFNVENLLCPHGCCRRRVLHSLCEEMGQEGPWYRLEYDEKAGRSWDATIDNGFLDVEAKRKIDVKVVGLQNDSEKEVFIRKWGLEVK